MSTMNHLLTEHFRCPDASVEFDWPSSDGSPEGFFQFGEDVVCFASSAKMPLAQTVSEPLHDALADVRFGSSPCVLTFDPVQAVGNLRRERYVQSSEASKGYGFPGLVRRAYYGARPFLSVSVRKHLQRMLLAGRIDPRFPDWPVDRTADRLLEKLLALSLRAQGKESVPFIWFWPHGHSSAAIMTHDVETTAGITHCAALMKLDEEYGIPASFQLIPEGRYRIAPSLFHEMRRRGFEINVHDLNHDGRLYWEREEFLRRAERINHYTREFGAKGFRAGVLYRNLDWYNAFDFSYDMSVPNVGHLGPQAGGCCTVMPYFVGRILELPVTTTEDYSLFQILAEYSPELWIHQIELIREGHGLISFITHPDYMLERRARATYLSLIVHLAHLRAEANLWLALPREVDEWWRARRQMTLAQRNGNWQIEGPGSERARIAYAILDGEGIRYVLGEESTGQTPFLGAIHPDIPSEVTTEMCRRPLFPEGDSAAACGSAVRARRETGSSTLMRRDSALHISFWVICFLSGIALWRPLSALMRLAYNSDYYSHTVVIPLLVACLVFLERKKIFTDSKPSLPLGVPLLFAGVLLFSLQRWALPGVGPEGRLSSAIFTLVLLWVGGFSLCYGIQPSRKALFPLLLLLLMVPLPMVAMEDFIHVTRVGSAEVASCIFGAFGVPVFRDGFLFVLPGFSIEIAKECSGIHSTIALFVLTLMAGYLFLRSTWKRAILLLCVFPIVSLTNGLRIATLTLLAEYVNRNIFNTSLHRDGGILFFLLAFGLISLLLRFLSEARATDVTRPEQKGGGQQQPCF